MTTCIAGLYDSQKAAGLLAIDRNEAHIHYSETKHGGQRLDDIQSWENIRFIDTQSLLAYSLRNKEGQLH